MHIQSLKSLNFKYTSLLLILIFTVLRYQGLISPYLHAKFYLPSKKDLNDIYFNDKFETFVYDFIPFDYTNDFYFIIFFLFICFLSYFFIYKILKKYSSLSEDHIFLTLLVLSSLDSFLFYDVKSSLSPFTQSPSTMISWSIFPIIIYFLLERRIYILSVLIFFNILFSIKFGLFPSLIIFIYCFLNEKEFIKKIFIFFPISLSLFLYYIFKSDITHDNIYNNNLIISKILENIGDLRDYLILEQRYLHLSLLIISFLIFFKNVKIVNKLFDLFNLFFYCTILLIIFHIFYFEIIFNYYPDIRIFTLSAVANLTFYQLFFVILLMHIIYNLNSSLLIKILFAFSIIYWNGEEVIWISKKISISLFLTAIFLYYLEKNKLLKVKLLKLNFSLILIILYFPILLANYYRFSSNLSFNLIDNASQKIFSETAGIDFLENSLINLKKCKNLPILVFYRNSKFINSNQHYLSFGKYPSKNINTYYLSTTANILANKSFFYEPNGRLFKNKKEYVEHYYRAEIFKKINQEINIGKLNIKKLEDKVDFPFLLILGDNFNNQNTQIFFVNKNLIPNTDLNCYKNL